MIPRSEQADCAERADGPAAAESVDAEQLRAQAQLIRSVNDNTTELIYMKDRRGRLIYANAAALQLMGMAPADIGTVDADLFSDTAEYGPIHAHDLRVMETGESISAEEPYTGADGVRRVYKSTKSPLFDDAGEIVGVIGVSTDISTLRASEDRQRFLLALSDALRPLGDAVRGMSSESEILHEAARLFGQHLDADRAFFEEVVAAEDLAIRHADYARGDLPSLAGRFKASDFPEAVEALATGQPFSIPDVAASELLSSRTREVYQALGFAAFFSVPLRKTGKVLSLTVVSSAPRVWIDAEIQLAREVAERTWAIVERVRAEAALRLSEERREMALQAAEMGAWDYDLVADVCHFDARARALYGVSSDTIDHSPEGVAGLFHPDDIVPMFDAIRRATDPTGDGRYDIDYRVVQRDGRQRWLRAWGKAEFEGEGAARRAVRIVGVSCDVSREKAAEGALRESEKQLKEADRRKDEFLATLAHELRNPLSPIATGLELIRVAGDTPESVAKVRTLMERQVAHMVRLIDDLMDVSRITSGKIALQREPTALSSIVASAVESNSAAMAQKHIDLEVELPEPGCVLHVDPTRFVQVISNLLHNATKFTDAGGTIAIRGRVHEDEVPGKRELTLVVSDSGSGIAPEFLPHVFDLFTQGDSATSQSGLGIGLALTRKLIEMHGGTIEVRSEGCGRGTEFVIRMPVSDEPPKVRTEDMTDARVDCRVLVIDDNRDAADTLAMLIEELGGHCRSAYDGESGLLELREYRPDVVLLDIGMSGLNGYETCRRIRRERGDDVLLVAVTGFSQQRDKEEARQAGFNAHLTKPPNPAALRKLLAQSEAAQRAASSCRPRC